MFIHTRALGKLPLNALVLFHFHVTLQIYLFLWTYWRALDSRTRESTRRRFFSKNSIKRAQTSVILAGKTWYRRHFRTRLCKNVVLSKQVMNTVIVLLFFNQQKGSVTSNKNNWAIYAGKKVRLIVRAKFSKYFRHRLAVKSRSRSWNLKVPIDSLQLNP